MFLKAVCPLFYIQNVVELELYFPINLKFILRTMYVNCQTASPRFEQWAPHIPGVTTLVAKKETKDGGNWTAIARQFQSSDSHSQVISLFVARSDGRENTQIFAFFFILRAQKWEEIDPFHKNLFVCIYPIWVLHILVLNVSKHAFSPWIKLRISDF